MSRSRRCGLGEGTTPAIGIVVLPVGGAPWVVFNTRGSSALQAYCATGWPSSCASAARGQVGMVSLEFR